MVVVQLYYTTEMKHEGIEGKIHADKAARNSIGAALMDRIEYGTLYAIMASMKLEDGMIEDKTVIRYDLDVVDVTEHQNREWMLSQLLPEVSLFQRIKNCLPYLLGKGWKYYFRKGK